MEEQQEDTKYPYKGRPPVVREQNSGKKCMTNTHSAGKTNLQLTQAIGELYISITK